MAFLSFCGFGYWRYASLLAGPESLVTCAIGAMATFTKTSTAKHGRLDKDVFWDKANAPLSVLDTCFIIARNSPVNNAANATVISTEPSVI